MSDLRASTMQPTFEPRSNGWGWYGYFYFGGAKRV